MFRNIQRTSSAIVVCTIAAAVLPAAEPAATPESAIFAAPEFQVELLYSVPKDEFGSWVNMCVDPQGRLIVSDQYGLLHRVTPPEIGVRTAPLVETIPVDIGEAQGLLWAFDSLYVVVNRGKRFDGGVYRVRDTDQDDQLDSVEQLRALTGRGEHGPHAILVAPDGESLFVVCGDGTPLTSFNASRVPRVWDEDLLLPRTYGRGFMKGVRAPGGYVARIDPAGKQWELVSVGFRNQYDAALNRDGELFTFDADMEWDMNTPWYRPTRVCHVVSGSEFGWRNGGGKWPAYYPDSLPATVDIGPGSPTGICFGYGAKFPAKFRNALFVSDWSYGKLYAVHLEPNGASYGGSFEEFVSGTPLPLTDVVVNPHDGAMYFTIGGRRVQSGLYRVTYAGGEPTTGNNRLVVDEGSATLRAQRKKIEELHLGNHPEAVATVWPYLGHQDRFLRYAARIALEHRPLSEWRDRALKESDPWSSLTALLALVRQYERQNRGQEPDIDTPPPNWDDGDRQEATPERAKLRARVLAALQRFDWNALSDAQRLSMLRVYTLTFLRLGPPTQQERLTLIDRFDPVFPAGDRDLDSELAQLLVYLQAPTVAPEVIALLAEAPTQEAQIDLAKTLRHLRAGWTPELREAYFSWFGKARSYRGGASFGLFVTHIQEDAIALLSDAEQDRLAELLVAAVEETNRPPQAPRPIVKKWQLDELIPMVTHELVGRNFDRGREMFAAANCFGCHRFDNQGGAIGPDLTALSGRFGPRDLLESIVDPDKVISDQYAAVTVVTDDGNVVTGRIVNLNGNTFSINTDMLDPNKQARIDRNQIEEMFPSKTSMMPKGLLDTLQHDEILDLIAYLFSGGDRNHRMFKTN